MNACAWSLKAGHLFSLKFSMEHEDLNVGHDMSLLNQDKMSALLIHLNFSSKIFVQGITDRKGGGIKANFLKPDKYEF